MRFGLAEVEVRGFRSALELEFSPGPLCALVGEARAGKSNLLAAVWRLLEPAAPELEAGDIAHAAAASTVITARLYDGREIRLERFALEVPFVRSGPMLPVVFFPAVLRGGPMMAASQPSGSAGRRALELFQRALADHLDGPRSSTGPALSFVRAVEACCEQGLQGLVLLIEEPELFLRPQAQRYLYRRLRELALQGNQVMYSTHAPAFLNVARLEELAFVERHPELGTRVLQPEPITPDEEFRVLSEFDAERSELFLARAALLVEGATEKLVFPFIFEALGYDADREAITIVDCAGKSKIPLFARICQAVGVPAIAVHDRDAARGREPIPAEQMLNQLVRQTLGAHRTVVLEPDFEGVSGLRGRDRKPERAWRRFARMSRSDIPEPLERAAEAAVALARG